MNEELTLDEYSSLALEDSILGVENAKKASDIARSKYTLDVVSPRKKERQTSYNLMRGIAQSVDKSIVDTAKMGVQVLDKAVDYSAKAAAWATDTDVKDIGKNLGNNNILFNDSDFDKSGNYIGLDNTYKDIQKYNEPERVKEFWGYDDSITRTASDNFVKAYKSGNTLDIASALVDLSLIHI